MKLKKEFLNSKMWVPKMNSVMIGKFIPEGVLKDMSVKFPELFERVKTPDKKMILTFEEELEQKLSATEDEKID